MNFPIPPPVFPLRLTWKGRIAVVAGSLLFIILALATVMGTIEEPMFRERARQRIDRAESLRELANINFEIGREQHLLDGYVVLAFVMALANSLLAMWRLGRSRSRAQFLRWMGLAGLGWAISLTAVYGTLHVIFLPEGIQDPRLPKVLCQCLFAFCIVDSLLVAGIALRMGKPPAAPAVAEPPILT